MFVNSLKTSRVGSALIRNLKASSVKSYHTNFSQLGGAHNHHEGEHDDHHDDHHHHEEPYTDGDGRLFGVAQGEQYKARGWEKRFFPLFYGGVFILLIGLAFKPDYSVQTWAKEEALRRRAARTTQ